MPIRFRCAYCNQLMGIARRKAGSVVRCPKCSGQVVVPSPSELEAVTPPPLTNPALGQAGANPGVPPTMPASGGVFEQDDFSRMFLQEAPISGPRPPAPPRPAAPPSPQRPAALGAVGFQQPMEYDVEPVAGPIQIRGIFLTPGLLTLAGMLIIVLMAAAFFVGWMIGRA